MQTIRIEIYLELNYILDSDLQLLTSLPVLRPLPVCQKLSKHVKLGYQSIGNYVMEKTMMTSYFGHDVIDMTNRNRKQIQAIVLVILIPIKALQIVHNPSWT